MKKFSECLISLRKERRETQEDLAKVIHKKRSTVSGYETEGKEPDLETVALLAKHFRVTTDYMLGLTNERTNAETVFLNDNTNFKKHFENVSADLRPIIAQTFDSFYLLLLKDMRQAHSDHLALYQKLLYTLQSSRRDICKFTENKNADLSDPMDISKLMSLQNELKNNVSSILDQLLQADFENAFYKRNGINTELPKQEAK